MGSRSLGPTVAGAATLCALFLPAHQVVAYEAACLRRDYSQPVVPAFGVVSPKRYSELEKTCWIDAQTARDDGWMPLDVRDNTVPARALLPGTVAVPLSSLADRAYLREQSLVLVGSGADLRALTDGCLALREQGFRRVRVLLGGARSWSGSPGGDLLEPQEFWLGALDGQWRIASLGLQTNEVTRLPLPPEVILPASTEGPALKKALADAERSKPSEPHQQWLVVARDGAGLQAAFGRWQSVVFQHSTPRLAWLVGGEAGYRTYLDQQQQSAAHAGRALPHICGS